METNKMKRLELIKKKCCVGFAIHETEHFIYVVEKTKLDPLINQIYAVKMGGKLSIQTSIDGLRLLAERSGNYSPGEDVHYEYQDDGHIVYAKCTVKKRTDDGTWHNITARAYWKEYVKEGVGGRFWKQLPHLMIAKCLPYRAKIETDMGTFQIGEIVNRKLEVKVRSINLKTGLEEWKPITNWIRNSGTVNWRRLTVATKKRGKNCIITTPEHLIMAEGGWKECQEIKIGEKIAVSSAVASNEQRQILIGSLLGDGSLSIQKGRTEESLPKYSESHSVKQQDYLIWKSKNLLNFEPRILFYTTTSNKTNKNSYKTIRLTLPVSPYFYDLYKKTYVSGIKKINKSVINELDDLGVAVWLMNDGNIKKSGLGSKCNPYIRLYTCCFENQKMFVEFFRNKYGITPNILREGKNPYLSFSVKDTKKLLDHLKNYIIFDEDINSKKWVAKDISIGPKNSITYMPCIKNEEFLSRTKYSGKGEPQKEGRYDITVKDNHNFLYNNILCHNCAEALALRKAFPQDLSGLYIKEEMDQASKDVAEYINSEQVDKIKEILADLSVEKHNELLKILSVKDFSKIPKEKYEKAIKFIKNYINTHVGGEKEKENKNEKLFNS